MNTYILTARIDEKSQAFFNEMRERYFPRERNLLKAHLTLFHKLPDIMEVFRVLEEINHHPICSKVSSLKNIGHGVAYFIDCPELIKLRQQLSKEFFEHLSLQDQQTMRPHVTIQNKVSPDVAMELLRELNPFFQGV